MSITKAISVLLLVLPSSVMASQYVSAITESVEFTAWVDDPKVLVKVTALVPEYPDFLSSLSVSYGNTTIEIPDQILQVAKFPHYWAMHLSYCGQSLIEGERPPKHPCLLLFLDYGEDSELETDRESAYLAISIYEGQVTGYTSYPLIGEGKEVELVH